jgi:hypothetical protein
MSRYGAKQQQSTYDIRLQGNLDEKFSFGFDSGNIKPVLLELLLPGHWHCQAFFLP